MSISHISPIYFEKTVRTSRRGKINFAAGLRDELGLIQDREAEFTPTARGLLITEETTGQHPVDRVCGILDGICDVDIYLEEIRGR